jgi:hypothetical protein
MMLPLPWKNKLGVVREMGNEQPSDRRAGYTHSRFEKYFNWAKAKNEFEILLNDNGDYVSNPYDLLQYRGCVSFAANPDTSPLLRAPCYWVQFDAMDRDLRARVADKVVEVWQQLGFMEGPVAAFVYRDYNSLGNGKQWFDAAGNNYMAFRKTFSQTLPVTVQLLFPSITRSGRRAPNFAALGTLHRWLADILEMPQTSYYNKYMMQCYTYCEDESGKFFPCGCNWKDECQAKVVGAEGVIDTTAKHTLFYGAYTLFLDHPWLRGAFAGARWRTLRQNILPMDVDLYNNCRFALKSSNEEFYAFQLTRDRCQVLRKGPVGQKRVCATTGWWIFSRTYCYDEPLPTKQYGEVCKTYESTKYGFRNCNDDNNMCADKSAATNAAFSSDLTNQQGYHEYYSLPFSKPSNRVRLSLMSDALVAYSEDRDQAGEVVWYWSFSRIPPERRRPPLALVLTDKGDLVLFNGDDEAVGSVSRKFGVDVYDDDGSTGDPADSERSRIEEMLNDLRQRAAAARSAADAQRAQRDFVLDKRPAGGDGLQCPAPPFDFI